MAKSQKMPEQLGELDTYEVLFSTSQAFAAAFRLMQLNAPFAIIPDGQDEYLLCYPSGRNLEDDIQRIRSRERDRGER